MKNREIKKDDTPCDYCDVVESDFMFKKKHICAECFRERRRLRLKLYQINRKRQDVYGIRNSFKMGCERIEKLIIKYDLEKVVGAEYVLNKIKKQ